jgi:hypothetical protein
MACRLWEYTLIKSVKEHWNKEVIWMVKCHWMAMAIEYDIAVKGSG